MSPLFTTLNISLQQLFFGYLIIRFFLTLLDTPLTPLVSLMFIKLFFTLALMRFINLYCLGLTTCLVYKKVYYRTSCSFSKNVAVQISNPTGGAILSHSPNYVVVQLVNVFSVQYP